MTIALDTQLPAEAHMLADWLTDGKPELGWRGDPRLELRLGVLTAAKHGYNTRSGRRKFYRKGDVVAYRYEVHRHNEDGTDTEVLHRAAADWHEIIPELVKLDPRTPGHVDTIDQVMRDNAAAERDNTRKFQDSYGEMTDHLWRLISDRQNGRNTTRQVPGRNPDKQL